MTRKEKGIIRARIYQRSEGFCEDCGAYIMEDSGDWRSMHLHHIKSRGAGGDWSDANLQALCLTCHMVTKHNPKSIPKKETIH